MSQPRTFTHTEPARLDFNGGYHDGAADVQTGRPIRGQQQGGFPLPSWNPAYCAGYRAGVADAQASTYAENSDAAWARHQQAA